MERLHFFFSLTYLTLSFSQRTSIVAPPMSVNITVNATANFTCTAIGDEIQWLVNGESSSVDDVRSKGFNDEAVPLTLLNATQNLYTRTLSAFGSVNNNGSNITCVAFSSVTMTLVQSEPAVLFVFEPGPVINLTVVSINSTTVLISWSPPFTLEGVPILGYNVTITNTTSGQNEIIETENTTLLNYTFFIDDPDPDSNFTVTVFPIYEAEYQPETNVTFMFPYNQVSTSSTSVSLSTPTSTIDMITTSTTIPSVPTGFVSTITSFIVMSATPTATTITPTTLPIIISVVAGSVLLLILLCTTVSIICCFAKRRRGKNHLTIEVVSLTEISSLQSSSLATPTESPPTFNEEPPRYATLDVFSHLVSKSATAEGSVRTSAEDSCIGHYEPSEEVDGFTVIQTPPTEASCQVINTDVIQQRQNELEEYVVVPSNPVEDDAAKIHTGTTSTQTQYAELGFQKKRPKAAIAPEKVEYAIISPQERAYANAGEQKRQAPLYGTPTDHEREEVAQATKHKWRLIGLQLGLDADYLDIVAEEHSDDQAQCCSTLFERWAHNELSGDNLQPFMWLSLITVLDGSLVRETNLARELENRINIRFN